MDLSKLTNENLIFLDCKFTKKEEVLKFLVEKLYADKKITSKEIFYDSVLEREGISPTGMDMGIAIPHGKSESVKEACFAVVKVNSIVSDWESIMPDNEVKYVFLLAIPKSEEGSTHLELLARLMEKMSNEEYLLNIFKSQNAKEFIKNLSNDIVVIKNDNPYTRTFLAVTACPSGIAHTYMAAENLVKAGNAMGIRILVEKQGANGIEDRHTSEDLKNADAVIFAVDVAVKNPERYSHLPQIKTPVAAPIKDAKSIIQRAIEKADLNGKGEFKATNNDADEKESFGSEIKKSVLTGISHIVPIIVAAGMIGAFAVLISNAFGLQELYNLENSWLWLFRRLGSTLLGTIMVPVLSAYMAYSISDKTALAPGFAAGVAANLVNGGFLAGMLGGILAGYIIRYFRKILPAKGTLAGFISFWVYPVFSTLLIGILMFFVIGTPIGLLNTSLVNYLGGLSGTNAALLGAIIGVMVSFDLGGPVNKAAYTFCVGAMAAGVFAPYAIFASIKMVSAFAVTIATLVYKDGFTEDEKVAGQSTWILGLAGITEGAIPFMMGDPIRVIISLCTGSAVAGAIVAQFGIGLNVPGAGIFSLFMLISDNPVLAPLVWLGAPIIGAIISATMLVVLRKAKLKKLATHSGN